MCESHLPTINIHVWWAFLHTEQAAPRKLEALLTEDERSRASRFRSSIDRDRFISRRGILRSILGYYLRRPATEFEFTYDRFGKPRLRGDAASSPIHFNMSHSQGVAVYAFSCRREVGIDVEAIRSDIPSDELAERFFTTRELNKLRSLPLNDRTDGFFLYWTRKEAYVKAQGSGFGIPLDSVDVLTMPGWTQRTFRPAPGYLGAVVAEGQDWELHLRDWASSNQ